MPTAPSSPGDVVTFLLNNTVSSTNTRPVRGVVLWYGYAEPSGEITTTNGEYIAAPDIAPLTVPASDGRPATSPFSLISPSRLTRATDNLGADTATDHPTPVVTVIIVDPAVNAKNLAETSRDVVATATMIRNHLHTSVGVRHFQLFIVGSVTTHADLFALGIGGDLGTPVRIGRLGRITKTPVDPDSNVDHPSGFFTSSVDDSPDMRLMREGRGLPAAWLTDVPEVDALASETVTAADIARVIGDITTLVGADAPDSVSDLLCDVPSGLSGKLSLADRRTVIDNDYRVLTVLGEDALSYGDFTSSTLGREPLLDRFTRIITDDRLTRDLFAVLADTTDCVSDTSAPAGGINTTPTAVTASVTGLIARHSTGLTRVRALLVTAQLITQNFLAAAGRVLAADDNPDEDDAVRLLMGITGGFARAAVAELSPLSAPDTLRALTQDQINLVSATGVMFRDTAATDLLFEEKVATTVDIWNNGRVNPSTLANNPFVDPDDLDTLTRLVGEGASKVRAMVNVCRLI